MDTSVSASAIETHPDGYHQMLPLWSDVDPLEFPCDCGGLWRIVECGVVTCAELVSFETKTPGPAQPNRARFGWHRVFRNASAIGRSSPWAYSAWPGKLSRSGNSAEH
jgi:hypothetical protein